MTKYSVTRLRDAFAVYETTVQAGSEDEAWAKADAHDYAGDWKQIEVRQFDHIERGKIEEVDEEEDAPETPAPSRLSIAFDIERRDDDFHIRATHRPDTVWHGPFPELQVLIDTLAHYIQEEIADTIAKDIHSFTIAFTDGGTDG
jgi:hypothetical protein